MSHSYQRFDPFLQPREAEHMFRVAESFGSFGTYADEGTSDGLGDVYWSSNNGSQHGSSRNCDSPLVRCHPSRWQMDASLGTHDKRERSRIHDILCCDKKQTTCANCGVAGTNPRHIFESITMRSAGSAFDQTCD